MAVRNIFKQSNMQMSNVSMEYFNIVVKSVIFFLNEGAFTRISSVQDERDSLK